MQKLEIADESAAREDGHVEAVVVAPASKRAPRRPARPGLAGALAALLLLGLYVALLARNQIDALLQPLALPTALQGGRLVMAVLTLGSAVALGARARQAGVRAATMRRWIAAHLPLLAITGISLGALVLRFLGIDAGLPYLLNPDEPAVADRALAMLTSGDFNPHYFVYPSLYYYMQAAVYVLRFFALVSAGKVDSLANLVPTDFYLWGRYLTGLLGALTAPLVYVAARRLYGQLVGLLAALFVATNTIDVFNAKWITVDVPAGFFSALALLAIVCLLPQRRTSGAMPDTIAMASLVPTSRYVLAGAAVGLAIGAKYNSALILLPLLLAHGYALGGSPLVRLRHFFGGKLWAALGATALAFLICTPFSVLDLPTS